MKKPRKKPKADYDDQDVPFMPDLTVYEEAPLRLPVGFVHFKQPAKPKPKPRKRARNRT